MGMTTACRRIHRKEHDWKVAGMIKTDASSQTLNATPNSDCSRSWIQAAHGFTALWMPLFLNRMKLIDLRMTRAMTSGWPGEHDKRLSMNNTGLVPTDSVSIPIRFHCPCANVESCFPANRSGRRDGMQLDTLAAVQSPWNPASGKSQGASLKHERRLGAT